MWDDEKFDDEFEQMFKQGKVFAAVVSVLVIAFFSAVLVAVGLGIWWLGGKMGAW